MPRGKTTALFRQQHEEIFTLAGAFIDARQDDAKLAAAAFTGKLLQHLVLEDQMLYPMLLMHDDQRIRSMAEQYVWEMGDLASDVKRFREKWFDKSANGDAAALRTELRPLLHAVLDRMSRENEELYALVDNLSE